MEQRRSRIVFKGGEELILWLTQHQLEVIKEKIIQKAVDVIPAGGSTLINYGEILYIEKVSE